MASRAAIGSRILGRDSAGQHGVRSLLPLMAGILGVVVAAKFVQLPWGQEAEDWSVDLRYTLRGPRAVEPSARIATSLITDQTWTVSFSAFENNTVALVTKLRELGAKSVGIDLGDNMPGNFKAATATQEDANKAQALSRLAARIETATGGKFPVVISSGPWVIVVPRAKAQNIVTHAKPTVESSAITRSSYPFFVQAKMTWPVCALTGDEPIAGAPANQPGKRKAYSFVATVAAEYLGGTKEGYMKLSSLPKVQSENGTTVIRANAVGARREILDADAITGGKLTRAQKASVRDATVLVGLSGDKGFYVPASGSTERVIANAEAVSTIVEGRPLGFFQNREAVLFTLVIGLIAVLITGYSTLFALFAGAIWLGIAVVAFTWSDWVLPLVGPLAAVVVGPFTRLAVSSALEKEARVRVEKLVDRLNSPEVAKRLLQNARQSSNYAENRYATILFFDVRGSTTMAESAPASAVLSELNELFEVVLPCVNKRRGVINRFLGDGFLAVFGLSNEPDHPRLAGKCALDIHAEVTRLNGQRKAEGKEPLRYGVGVHTGQVAVGNLGTKTRYEFTVIGDTVNTAAKLEKSSKTLEASVVISDDVYRSMHESQLFKGPVSIALDGRVEPVIAHYL